MTQGAARTLSSALLGCTIVVAVDRRSTELAAALERHGASVRRAPALTIVPHIDDDALIRATEQLIAAAPDIVVATTGVGFRGWMEAAEEAGLLDGLTAALGNARIIARGPKARGAIQPAGFSADWVAESETSAELGDYLENAGVAGQRIAVQHHGSGADGLDERFERAGAEVVSLTVYRWGPPPDIEALERTVAATADGEVDAVLFTSAPGAAEWLAAASRAGALGAVLNRADRGEVVLAAVGPVTAGPLIEAGFTPLVPERGRLGSLVRGVVNYFGNGCAPALQTTLGRLELRSTGAILDGTFHPLSRTSLALLRELFHTHGGIVTRDRLRDRLARPGEGAHAVDVAIARLREATDPGLVQTVVKRGYRLNLALSSHEH